MLKVVNQYQKENSVNPNKLYVFLVDSATKAEQYGYSAFGQPFIYIFADRHKNGIKDIAHSIAHEIGHAAFLLEHPIMLTSEAKNLMETSATAYSKPEKNELWLIQWDVVHGGNLTGFWGEGREYSGNQEEIEFKEEWESLIEKIGVFQKNDSDIVFNVYILGDPIGVDEYKAAAYTRLREIKQYDKNSKVYMLNLNDIGLAVSRINAITTDAKKKKYGKTIEFSWYGHCGSDGPSNDVAASMYGLHEETGRSIDKGQITSTAWRSIDFNWNPNRSYAGFYGCLSAEWANRFVLIQNVQVAVGFVCKAGASENSNEFDANWFLSEGEDIYMMDNCNLYLYKRPSNDFFEIWDETINDFRTLDFTNSMDFKKHGLSNGEDTPFSTNFYIDINGNYSGHKYNNKK